MKIDKRFLLTGVVVVALIAYFIVVNVFFDKYNGSLGLVGEWESVEYRVVTGNADKLSIKLQGKSELKVVYNGDYDLEAIVTLTDAESKTEEYDLHIYEDYNTAQESTVVQTDFTRVGD